MRLTQVGRHGVHVGVVSLPDERITGAVAVGEEAGGVVGDRCEEHQGDRPHDPAELRRGPGEGQHAGADDGRDNVRARCPYRPCSTNCISCQSVLGSFSTIPSL